MINIKIFGAIFSWTGARQAGYRGRLSGREKQGIYARIAFDKTNILLIL